MKGSIILASIFFSSVALAETADIVGHYTCNGMDPVSNTAYTGTVDITKDGDVYSVMSQYSNNESDTGTGIMMSGNNDIAIVFLDKKEGSKPGVQHYSVTEAGKKLAGPWAYLGSNKVGSESCVKGE